MIRIGSLKDLNEINKNDKDVILVNKTTQQEGFEYREEQRLEESNIIKDVINNLDNDTMQEDNLTSIDFNTRLQATEIPAIVSMQMLHTFKVGGRNCSLLARTIKRHKVSLGGLGRTEKVQIIQGEREHETDKKGDSLFGKIKGYLTGNNKNES